MAARRDDEEVAAQCNNINDINDDSIGRREKLAVKMKMINDEKRK